MALRSKASIRDVGPARHHFGAGRRSAVGLRVAAAALTLPLLIGGCATLRPEPPGCPPQDRIDEQVARYIARQPTPNPPPVALDAALCGRDKLVAQLRKTAGPVVGYKAGLTNTAVQKRFNHPAPLRGTLLQQMVLQDGAEVSARFGARPLYEADLVVTVRSSAIHGARTPLEVLGHLVSIHPFIELPDLAVEDPARIDGPTLALVNVGARLGVLGAGIPVRATQETVDALAAMTVRLIDGDGKELDSGRGSAILGHPLNAVIWLAEDLQRAGITLKPGDLLSLGSFTRLLPPRPGMTVRAIYEGLPGNPSVSVRFR